MSGYTLRPGLVTREEPFLSAVLDAIDRGEPYTTGAVPVMQMTAYSYDIHELLYNCTHNRFECEGRFADLRERVTVKRHKTEPRFSLVRKLNQRRSEGLSSTLVAPMNSMVTALRDRLTGPVQKNIVFVEFSTKSYDQDTMDAAIEPYGYVIKRNEEGEEILMHNPGGKSTVALVHQSTLNVEDDGTQGSEPESGSAVSAYFHGKEKGQP